MTQEPATELGNSPKEICEKLGIKDYVHWIPSGTSEPGHSAVRDYPQNKNDPSIWFPTASYPSSGWSLDTFASIGLTGKDQELVGKFLEAEQEIGSNRWRTPLGKFMGDVGDILYDYEHHRDNTATPRYRTSPTLDGNQKFKALGSENEPLSAEKCKTYIDSLRQELNESSMLQVV